MPYEYWSKFSPVFWLPFKYRTSFQMMISILDYHLNTRHLNAKAVWIYNGTKGFQNWISNYMTFKSAPKFPVFIFQVFRSYCIFLTDIWGPFLVITPASTLHNWQQEVAKFLPSFKVVPYWGSPQERKILRHFWDQTNLHTRSASFHLVITSYQVRQICTPNQHHFTLSSQVIR